MSSLLLLLFFFADDDLGGGGGGAGFGTDFCSFRLTPARLGMGGFVGLEVGDGRLLELLELPWLHGKDNGGGCALFEVAFEELVLNIPMVTF